MIAQFSGVSSVRESGKNLRVRYSFNRFDNVSLSSLFMFLAFGESVTNLVKLMSFKLLVPYCLIKSRSQFEMVGAFGFPFRVKVLCDSFSWFL